MFILPHEVASQNIFKIKHALLLLTVDTVSPTVPAHPVRGVNVGTQSFSSKRTTVNIVESILLLAENGGTTN